MEKHEAEADWLGELRETSEHPWSNDPRRVLEVVPKWQCLELLPMVGIGRLAVCNDTKPEVFPVNYARLGPDIVFMTGPGTKLDAAARSADVVFEVDHADATFHTGWSVVIKGHCEEITAEPLLHRARRLPLSPWAPGNRHHYVRIVDEEVSGRRIVPLHDGHRHRAAPEYLDTISEDSGEPAVPDPLVPSTKTLATLQATLKTLPSAAPPREAAAAHDPAPAPEPARP